MPVYKIEREQFIPATPEAVWNFMSSPANLKNITPPYMGFDIVSENLPEKMYPGMIIQYKVRPLFGIPLGWTTEITHVTENVFFVDEQRHGPYALWHHQHHIREVEGGVLMTDIVHYKPPLGFLGAIANTLLIRKKLHEIFAYRFVQVEKYFGSVTK